MLMRRFQLKRRLLLSFQATPSEKSHGTYFGAAVLRDVGVQPAAYEVLAWKESSNLLSAGPPHQHDD